MPFQGSCDRAVFFGVFGHESQGRVWVFYVWMVIGPLGSRSSSSKAASIKSLNELNAGGELMDQVGGVGADRIVIGSFAS